MSNRKTYGEFKVRVDRVGWAKIRKIFPGKTDRVISKILCENTASINRVGEFIYGKNSWKKSYK